MIEDILPRLEKVKRTGPSNWLACCPAHDDSNPSLTIRAEDDGRILIKCFAGCSFEEIVVAVGLGWEPWFPPKPPQLDSVPPTRRPFPAADVLEALWFETMVVAVTAADIAGKKEVSAGDLARMWVAFERINEGRDLALGQR